MSDRIERVPVRKETPAERSLSSKLLFVLALALLGSIFVFSLYPALFAPISADDRYWAIETPARFASYLEVVTGTFEDNAAFIEAGRVSTIGRLARRLVHQATFDVSRLTSTSLVTSLAVAKLILLAAAVSSCLAFVRAIRWRSPGGGLVGIGRASTTVAGASLIALLAGGVQTHAQFRNAWISYAPHTYLAATIIFGTAAASVVLARRVADRRPGAIPTGVFLGVLFAVLWNWTYELNYLGLPLALFALFVFPLAPSGRDVDQRRGRLIVGGTLASSWVILFAVTRLLLAGVCTGDGCYVGTSLSLGADVFRTVWFNLVSSFPGSSGAVFLKDLEAQGSAHRWTTGTVGNLWVASVLMGASLLVVWYWAAKRWPVPEERRSAERSLLLLGAVGSVGVGHGGALIMSLSIQAQEVISRVGLPYRHTVLTWTATALAVALAGRAVHLSASSWLRVASITVVLGMVVLTSAYTLPRNLVSTQAYSVTPANRSVADIHWEVIAGDLTEGGDERRCLAFERAEASVNSYWLTARLQPAADTLFMQLYGEPFCSHNRDH